MRVLFDYGIAYISKPRCGSTSLRSTLDSLDSKEQVSSSFAGDNLPFHPHITAPALQCLLKNRQYTSSNLSYFTVTRNPLDMLWSYYKFFRPDSESKYWFQPSYDESSRMEFMRWLNEGKLGMSKFWKELAPEWISTENLSPLSLEAHVQNSFGTSVVEHVFYLEDLAPLQDWLSALLSRRGLEESKKEIANLQILNASAAKSRPHISAETLTCLRKSFPLEFEIYNI